MAKCPKCEKGITYVRFKAVDTRQSFGSNAFNAVAHCCPHCDSVLSVEIDPVAMKTDIVNQLLRDLRK